MMPADDAGEQMTSAQGWRLLAVETSSPVGTVALACGADVAERAIPTPREQTERLLPLVDELLAEAGLGLADLDAIVFGRGPGSFTGLRIAAALAQGLALAADRPVVAVSSLAALAQRAAREHGATRVVACVDARMNEVYWGRYARGTGATAGQGHGAAAGPAAGRDGAAAAGRGGSVDVGRRRDAAAGAAAGQDRATAAGRDEAASTGRDGVAAAGRGGAAAAGPAGPAASPMEPECEERLGPPEDVRAPASGEWFAAGSGWGQYAAALRPLAGRAIGVDEGLVPAARDLLPRAGLEIAAGRLLEPEQALPVYLRSETAWRRRGGAGDRDEAHRPRRGRPPR